MRKNKIKEKKKINNKILNPVMYPLFLKFIRTSHIHSFHFFLKIPCKGKKLNASDMKGCTAGCIYGLYKAMYNGT